MTLGPPARQVPIDYLDAGLIGEREKKKNTAWGGGERGGRGGIRWSFTRLTEEAVTMGAPAKSEKHNNSVKEDSALNR